MAGGQNVDIDAAREVVDFDIDHASKWFDMTTSATVALPPTTTQGV
jgi:hypothetical protein